MLIPSSDDDDDVVKETVPEKTAEKPVPKPVPKKTAEIIAEWKAEVQKQLKAHKVDLLNCPDNVRPYKCGGTLCKHQDANPEKPRPRLFFNITGFVQHKLSELLLPCMHCNYLDEVWCNLDQTNLNAVKTFRSDLTTHYQSGLTKGNWPIGIRNGCIDFN